MALHFDAYTERVDHGTSATLDGMTSGSILMWIKPELSQQSYARFFWKGPWNAGGTPSISMQHVGASDIFSVAVQDTGEDTAGKQNYLTQNIWYRVGFTWSGMGNVPLLYGGTLASPLALLTPDSTTNTLTAFDDSGEHLYVGSRGTTIANFLGDIALTVFWKNRVLTESEMRAQSCSLFPIIHCADMVLFCNYFWPWSNQVDWSGNGNHGTLTGATAINHVPLRLFRTRPNMPFAAAPGYIDYDSVLRGVMSGVMVGAR